MAERYVALKPGTHTQVCEVTGWLLREKPQASSLRRVWVPGPGRALAGPEGSAGGLQSQLHTLLVLVHFLVM